MSLVEVVVAVVVLGIVSSAVLGIILQAQASGVNNRNRIAAANLAVREIDILRDEFGRTSTSPRDIADAGTVTNGHPLDAGSVGDPLIIDGTSYTVVREVAWNILGDGESACEGGSLVQYPTLGVTVTVTWPDMGQTQPVVSHASLAPAKGEGVPGTASFVAVSVVDSAGDPNAHRTVRVTGGGVTRTGTTDDSGCAVVEVSPSTGGTDYVAEVADTGYVDINGSAAPSKSVGILQRGQLNSSVSFAYDLAATLRLQVVDEGGSPVTDAVAAGSSVSVVSVGSSGETVTSSHSVTGAVTELTGLWPTSYGAYFGAAPPAGGYPTAQLTPGSTETLDVTLAMARASVVDMPAGTTSVIAVPGTGACTAAGARTVDPAGFTVIPGPWTFYASGPTFTCSPGPAAQDLTAGDNDAVVWEASTLQLSGVPASGTVWAVSIGLVSGTLTTCPGAAYAGVAVNVDGARSAPLAVPAGDWYVYRTDGAAVGTCLGTPSGQYPKAVTYGSNTVLGWTEVLPTATLTVTGIDRYRYVIFSTQTVSGCTSTGYTTTGTAVSVGQAPTNNATLFTTVARPASGTETWFTYIWRKGSSPGCTSAGRFVVGTTTSSLTKSASSTGSVGP